MIDILAYNNSEFNTNGSLNYSLYNRTNGKVVKITNQKKIIQDVIMELLTQTGSIMCYPRYGCDFTTSLIGVSNNIQNFIKSAISRAIFQVKDNILYRTPPTLPDREQLSNITVTDIQNKDDYVNITISIETKDGATETTALQLY